MPGYYGMMGPGRGFTEDDFRKALTEGPIHNSLGTTNKTADFLIDLNKKVDEIGPGGVRDILLKYGLNDDMARELNTEYEEIINYLDENNSNPNLIKFINKIENGNNEVIKFTQEEIDLVTKACFVIYNINYAMKYIDRGTEGNECTPTLDKCYRELDDPTRSEITNDIFNFKLKWTEFNDTDLGKLVSSIMKKIKTNYKNR